MSGFSLIGKILESDELRNRNLNVIVSNIVNSSYQQEAYEDVGFAQRETKIEAQLSYS